MQEKGDDPSIDNAEVLYRRISNVGQASFMIIDEKTGARRPTSALFRPDKDGLSVYLDSVLRRHGLTETAVLTRPESGVLSLTAQDVRDEELGVAADPWPAETDDRTHKRNAAHALIVGLVPLSKSQLKLKQRALIAKCKISIDPVQA